MQGAVEQGGGWKMSGAGRRFYFAGLLSVVGGLLLWELVSRFLVANTLFLAAPTQIFAAIVALAKTGELWRHLRISGIEFVLGYVIASVLGIVARPCHGRERGDEARAAAVGLGALRHADHRARAAVHPVVGHRHLVEGAGGDHPGVVSGRPSTPKPGCARPATGWSKCCARSAPRRGRYSSRFRCRPRCRSSSPV